MNINPRRSALRVLKTAGAVYAATFAAVRLRRCRHAGPVVAFAGGGAGCHVFPAIAIAEELRKHAVEAVFLGESRGLEVHVVPQYGFTLYCISSVGLQRPLKSVANALNVMRFPLCVAHSAWALLQAAPDVVVGLGGKVSVPACVAAVALGIPLVLYEPNAKAGAANQALHGLARQTLLAYDSAAAGLRHPARCKVVGPAVRAEVLRCAAGGPTAVRRRRREAREALGVTARGSRLLLVLGGSRGCGYLNCALNNALPQLTALPVSAACRTYTTWAVRCPPPTWCSAGRGRPRFRSWRRRGLPRCWCPHRRSVRSSRRPTHECWQTAAVRRCSPSSRWTS
ncbi:hypothetical protein PLESTF_001511600 [Pleodorina starrii]|nr:hypothetical protein PLESTF_001511600 [Pleodorina starrii]